MAGMLIVRGASPHFTTRYLRLSVIFCKQWNVECKLCPLYSYHVPQGWGEEGVRVGGGSGDITHSTHGGQNDSSNINGGASIISVLDRKP